MRAENLKSFSRPYTGYMTDKCDLLWSWSARVNHIQTMRITSSIMLGLRFLVHGSIIMISPLVGVIQQLRVLSGLQDQSLVNMERYFACASTQWTTRCTHTHK
ncbi:hypothetical protein GDO81_022770 [Engystomops pustulosus]|uniref:Uncharacterized protein n=1 Tax=Engystomops pustulosus TaxID=76066 RepID=A0AAV6ZEJ9_ENGPU|nr:hypothetical protein GDO81_022770 [Engystomops pustulosus]